MTGWRKACDGSKPGGGNVSTARAHAWVLTETTMRTKLVKIGNSQGVRIPRALIEEAGLEGDLDLSLEYGSIVLRRAGHPRDGWAGDMKRMHEAGDDVMETVGSEWDEQEWEWQ
jgi:antitoxin MazE